MRVASTSIPMAPAMSRASHSASVIAIQHARRRAPAAVGRRRAGGARRPVRPCSVPEILEVEAYRRAAASRGGAAGRSRSVRRDALVPQAGADAPKRWSPRSTGADGRRPLGGAGKLLLLDTDGPVLGLRFGMTGRLVVDDVAAVDELEYALPPGRPGAGTGSCSASTPVGRCASTILAGSAASSSTPTRRPSASTRSTVSERQLTAALAGSQAPLKARLLDQARLAGVGNLLADEALWRAGLDPARPAASLDRRRDPAAPPGPPADAEACWGSGAARISATCSRHASRVGTARGMGRRWSAAPSVAARPTPAPLTSTDVPPRLGRRRPRVRDWTRHANRPPTRRRGPRGRRRGRGRGRTGAGAVVRRDGTTPASAFEQVVVEAKTTTTVKKRTHGHHGQAIDGHDDQEVVARPSRRPRRPRPRHRRWPPRRRCRRRARRSARSPRRRRRVAPINDSTATRLVNRVIFALVGLALLVAFLTFWYWRATKPVPPALDGLDLLSTRKWLRAKPDKRARLLAEFHAKRGPVAEEVIARTNAPTVKVGAAVAAPEPAPWSCPAWRVVRQSRVARERRRQPEACPSA